LHETAVHVSLAVMKVAPRAYRSPLRRAHAAATRDRILDAVAAVFEQGGEPTYAAIAAHAGVQERTVYRHFPTKDALHREFWRRLHEQRIGVTGEANDLPALLATVADSYRGFSRNAALVRAMLHSTHGRAIRSSSNAERRRRYERIVATELPGLGRAARRQAAAATHVLCSAMSWEYLQDYWGLSTAQAVATVQEAVVSMLRGWPTPARHGARKGSTR
jgi:AcrR family transcriptional regulator